MSLRIVVIQASFIVLAAAPVFAGPREDTLAGISRCAALPDDRTFLECVYGAAQPLRARLGLPPAPESQVRLVPPASARADMPPTTRPDGTAGGVIHLFGSNALHMMAYSFDPRGLFTVTLSNGDVWRQDPNDTNYAHWSGKAADYPVTVTPGEFGSRLDVRGEAGTYRVERIR